jgi:4-amino-4-deoxy-L-arabinose transferase-like glycosyltransferase
MNNMNSPAPSKFQLLKWFYIIVPFFIIWFGLQIFLAARVFSLDYDEGVYLLTALMHKNGLSLYKDLFVTQPPLTIELLTVLVKLFGNSVLIPRLSIIVSGFLTIMASFLIARDLFDRNTAILTILLCGINYSLFNASSVVQTDMQSLTLSLFSMYTLIRFNKTKHTKWLIVSAVLFGLTIMVKLLEPFFVFVFSYLLIFDIYNKNRLFLYDRKTALRAALNFIIYGAFFFSVVAAILFWYDVPSFKAQVIGMGGEPVRMPFKPRIIIETYFEWYLILFLYAVAGVYHLFSSNNRKAIFFIVWICAQLTFHFLMSAWVLEHHLIVLFPILSMLAAYGLRTFIERYRSNELRLLQKMQGKKAAYLAVILIFVIFYVMPSIAGIGYMSYQRTHRDKNMSGAKLVPLIEGHTDSDDLIVTDEQLAIYITGRNTYPDLVETSQKRISTGYLSESDLLDLIPEPVLVAFWRGRISAFEVYARYIDANYKLIYEDKGRKVYIKESEDAPEVR